MKKDTTFSFERNYRVRASIIVLIAKIVMLEISFFIISTFINLINLTNKDLISGAEVDFYAHFFLLTINIACFVYLSMSWNFKYFIVSQHGILMNSGVILRNSHSIDIPAIRSIDVHQSLAGRIFNYGTLKLESPLLKDIFLMVNLPDPFRHAGLIESARLKAITHEKSEVIIPSA